MVERPIENVLPVKEGDPISAADWNAILRKVKGSDLTTTPLLTSSPDIEAVTHTAITKYNIYTIGCCPADEFAYSRCRSKTKTYATGDLFLATIDRNVDSGKRGFFVPLAYGVPYILAYDYAGTANGTGTAGGSPSPGEEWGLLNGGTVLEEDGSGFIILSNPDTVNRLVWAARIAPAVGGGRIVQATLSSQLCGESDNESTTVTDAFYTDNCEDIDLTGALIYNRCRHQGVVGDIVKLHATCTDGTGSGTGGADAWDILDVQKHPTCVVHQVQSRDFCMVQLIVKVAAERCGELDSTCTILEYVKDCTETGVCDTETQSDEYDLSQCCFTYVLGTGSWGSGGQ